MTQSPKQLEKACWGRLFAYVVVWIVPGLLLWIVDVIQGLLSPRLHYHPHISEADHVYLAFLYGMWTMFLMNHFGKKETEIEEERLRRENICAFCKTQFGEGDLVYSMQLHRFVCGDCLPSPGS